MFTQKTITKTIILLAVFTLALSVNYLFAAWTGPTQAPPGGNTPTPVHVGTINQVKDGGLSLNALSVFGGGYFQGGVSIGTTELVSRLNVKNTKGFLANFEGETTHVADPNTYISLKDTTGGIWWRIKAGNDGNFAIRSELQSDWLTILKDTGYVGIGPGYSLPTEQLDVIGGIKIGNTNNTNAGTIRWTGSDFEGYDGTQWVSLTSG